MAPNTDRCLTILTRVLPKMCTKKITTTTTKFMLADCTMKHSFPCKFQPMPSTTGIYFI